MDANGATVTGDSDMDQELQDRAAEWVNENCPDLEGAAYDQKVAEVAAELALIDQAADDLDRQ